MSPLPEKATKGRSTGRSTGSTDDKVCDRVLHLRSPGPPGDSNRGAFSLQADWLVELDEEQRGEDEPELVYPIVLAYCYLLAFGELLEPRGMIETPSVAPSQAWPFIFHLNLQRTKWWHPHGQKRAFDHLDHRDIFKRDSHVHRDGEQKDCCHHEVLFGALVEQGIEG